jgi:hypothetical protein
VLLSTSHNRLGTDAPIIVGQPTAQHLLYRAVDWDQARLRRQPCDHARRRRAPPMRRYQFQIGRPNGCGLLGLFSTSVRRCLAACGAGCGAGVLRAGLKSYDGRPSGTGGLSSLSVSASARAAHFRHWTRRSLQQAEFVTGMSQRNWTAFMLAPFKLETKVLVKPLLNFPD